MIGGIDMVEYYMSSCRDADLKIEVNSSEFGNCSLYPSLAEGLFQSEQVNVVKLQQASKSIHRQGFFHLMREVR